MFDIIIGVSGMLLILFAFIMDQTHRWTSDDLGYDFLNFLGSFFLAIYAITLNSIPFLILQLVWALFSLKDTILDIQHRKKGLRRKSLKKIMKRKNR